MNRKIAFLAAGVSLVGCVTAVFAQSVDGFDPQAIEARAGEFQEDAQALFDYVTANEDEHREEAQTVVEEGYTQIEDLDVSDIAGGDGPFDFDEMVAGAKAGMANPRGAPLFIAFASLSMPEESLSRMIEETTKAGGVVVFRGFFGRQPAGFHQRHPECGGSGRGEQRRDRSTFVPFIPGRPCADLSSRFRVTSSRATSSTALLLLRRTIVFRAMSVFAYVLETFARSERPGRSRFSPCSLQYPGDAMNGLRFLIACLTLLGTGQLAHAQMTASEARAEGEAIGEGVRDSTNSSILANGAEANVPTYVGTDFPALDYDDDPVGLSTAGEAAALSAGLPGRC